MCFVADFQVRLNGSSLSFAGTINVLYYGIWSGILGFYVDIRVGHVVCRQLGYSRAERIFSYASFGRVIGPLWIWSIQCNGNETEISQCKVETWDMHHWYYSYYQRPGYAASLLCSKENSSLSKGKYGDQYLRKQPSSQPSNCSFKRGSKNNFIPRLKKGHFYTRENIFKNIYQFNEFKMRPKIKWTNSTKHHNRLASSNQTGSNDFQAARR